MRVIEVFADVACPFTHVGLRRFVARRREVRSEDLLLHVRSWPLELVNGEPLDPGHVAEEVDEIREQVAPELFAGFDRSNFPATSMPALALAAAAYEVDIRTGEAVSLGLRDLLFEQGKDVSERSVLEAVARDQGVDVDLDDHGRVRDDYAAGRARGVQGSPHFFTAGGNFFCPSLDVGRDEAGRLRITPDTAGLDQFMQACFG